MSNVHSPHRRLHARREEEKSLTTQYVGGEKTAQMLESNLTNLEKKIDDLLASFEAQQESTAQAKTKDETKSKKEATDENAHEGS